MTTAFQGELERVCTELSRKYHGALEDFLQRCIDAGLRPHHLEYPAPSMIPPNTTSYVIVRGEHGTELGRAWIEMPDLFADSPMFKVHVQPARCETAEPT